MPHNYHSITEARKMFKELMVVLEILATILTIVSFYLISENILLVGFSLSLLGQLIWLIWAADKNAHGIFIVNVALAVASTNGLMTAIQVL